jgi:pimeloyl-ACP methyl ester carboxylesterase
MAPRYAQSADGTRIAVHESGDPAAPTIVAVHGYPDNHAVWDGVAAGLAERFHVVAYDVRGTGDSDKPAGRRAYRIAHLTDDLLAVLDEVCPHSPAHLLGHDWGSVQLWSAVTDDRVAGRVATFTSISGPSLDYSAAWLRRLRSHPGAALRQLAHSYYVGLFQLPALPELAARRGLIDRGVEATSRRPSQGHPPRSEADKVNGIQLYRANMFHRLSRPRPVPTDVPVQVIVLEQDSFVTPALAEGAPAEWVADLTIDRIAAGHWAIVESPEVVAGLVTGFLTAR